METFLGGKVMLHRGNCLEVLPTLAENSIDSCVTDPPYLLTSIVQRFGADGAAPAKIGSDGRYRRLSGGFMNQRWDAPGASHGLSVFEAWLAGFIAGEGCFRIQAHKNNRYYTCQFTIHLRQDDTPILIACQKRIGGRIVFHDARENRQGVKSAPDVRWIIDTQDGCLALANILDRVPLFAKKAKDYTIWRRALNLWLNTPKGSRWHGARDVTEIAYLHRELQSVKRWDGTEPDLNFDPFMPPTQAFHYHWAREVYRVLKPGAHLLAFGGTRTFHRMAVAIEDAGFEVRDTIMWLYGTGFPKSHDVSKGIDKAAGAKRPRLGTKVELGVIHGQGDANKTMHEGWQRPWRDNPDADAHYVTSPATLEAAQWQGWGTALKPACEPIILARKPLSEGTVAANVLKWGTGAINVGACRVRLAQGEDVEKLNARSGGKRGFASEYVGGSDHPLPPGCDLSKGRWPANVITDGSEEVVGAFPETKDGGAKDSRGNTHLAFSMDSPRKATRDDVHEGFGNSCGSAARFFYSAKADGDDRLGSKHPTVKPVDLMQYLVRLITPPRGICLDPFAGTGSAGEAAWREGMSAILIEREDEYCTDICRRMQLVLAGPDERLWQSIKARGQVESPGPLFDVIEYDATDDFARSIDEAYAAIRARKAAGGKGWPNDSGG